MPKPTATKSGKRITIRYSKAERELIVIAARTLKDQYDFQPRARFIRAAIKKALPADRWRPVRNATSAQYDWFIKPLLQTAPASPVEEVTTIEPIPIRFIPMSNLKAISTADMMQEMVHRCGMALEIAERIPEALTAIKAELADIQERQARVVTSILRLERELWPDTTITAQPLVLEDTPPAPAPKVQKPKIVIVGPLPQQQNIIRDKVNGAAKLVFVASDHITNDKFDGAHKVILTTQAPHHAYYKAIATVGREHVSRLHSSGLGTITDAILAAAQT